MVSPTLPIGNCVRINTKSELKVRIKSIRCCSESWEEGLSSARHSALNRQKAKTMTGKTRGRIQVPIPIIFFDGKGRPPRCLHRKKQGTSGADVPCPKNKTSIT